jgi:uncharacterized protein YbjT (DUF2867 family)
MSMTSPTTTPILVLGATGKTGARVARRLWDQGLTVRAGSRQADPPFDWENEATWTAALTGVEAVYVTYQPDLAAPGALPVVKRFFAEAANHGVRKVVLLSGRGEPEAIDAEEALQATRLDWTIIRASWFHQNFSENFFLEAIQTGTLVLPEGLAPEPFVDVEDIADIAAQALVDPRHSRKLYEVTGPRALTFGDAVDEIGRVIGREITLITVPLEAYRQGLLEALPADLVQLIIYLFTTVLDGRNTPVAHGVERALSRAPGSFEAYAARTVATGVWGGNQEVRPMLLPPVSA